MSPHFPQQIVQSRPIAAENSIADKNSKQNQQVYVVEKGRQNKTNNAHYSSSTFARKFLTEKIIKAIGICEGLKAEEDWKEDRDKNKRKVEVKS